MSTATPDRAYGWREIVQYWLLPGTCIRCRRPSGRRFDLCIPCAVAFVRPGHCCEACALPLPPEAGRLCGRCYSHRPLDLTCAGFLYDESIGALISQFKYRGRLQHGRVLASLFEPALRERYRDRPWPQLLLPVPLHPRRLRERGFNQAELLARQLGRALGVPVAPHLLRRIRHTPAQQGLAARDRKRNLRGAFALAEPPALAGLRRIALVDDVITTASTMRELARLLRRHGDPALEIHAWCLARA